MRFFLSAMRDKRGVSALEYAILAGIVTVGLVAALGDGTTGLRGGMSHIFANVTTTLNAQ